MKKQFLTILTVGCATLMSLCAVAQGNVGVKTNLLYGAGALTPNLGLEIGLGKRTTIEFTGSYNPWNRKGSPEDNRKLVHALGQAELRLYTCEKMSGHFFGLHGFYGGYNISGYSVPFLLKEGSGPYRYEGDIVGAGLSYGYQWVVGKHLNIEFTVGAGYGYQQYDRYYAEQAGALIENVKRPYFGPTKGGISVMYVF